MQISVDLRTVGFAARLCDGASNDMTTLRTAISGGPSLRGRPRYSAPSDVEYPGLGEGLPFRLLYSICSIGVLKFGCIGL